MKVYWPRLEEYLATLPEGAASYPEYETKASAYRTALEWRPLPRTVEGLPEALHARLAEPALPSAWIPEVHGMALGLAIADHHGMSEEEFLRFVFEMNRALLGGPRYRYLMSAEGPAAMFKHAQVRWKAMHRGVQLSAVEVGEHVCSFRMVFAPHLYNGLLLRAFAQTFKAGLGLAQTPEARVELTGFGDARADYSATW